MASPMKLDLKLAPSGSALRIGGQRRKAAGRRVSFSKQLTTDLRTPSPAAAPRSPPKVKRAALKEKRSRGPRVKAEPRKKAARKGKAAKRGRKAGQAAKRGRKAGQAAKRGRKAGQAAKRGRKAGQAVKRGLRRRIDFSKIRWGTFTKRFVAWKRRHPRAKVSTLREFAAYVLAHPDKFSLRARRKALFYRNIILKGKVKMPIAKYVRGRKSRTTPSRPAASRKAARKGASRKAARKGASRKAARK
jgi:hypothetical protein